MDTNIVDVEKSLKIIQAKSIMQPVEKFEKEFGLEYDPEYDDPLLEEELPKDLKFIKLSVFGDRMYEDGSVYFKDGDVYFRRGAKPRLRSFWESR